MQIFTEQAQAADTWISLKPEQCLTGLCKERGEHPPQRQRCVGLGSKMKVEKFPAWCAAQTPTLGALTKHTRVSLIILCIQSIVLP